MNEIKTGCGNCWFCRNGQCSYALKCDGQKKWNATLYSFVPITYQERTDLRWQMNKKLKPCPFCSGEDEVIAIIDEWNETYFVLCPNCGVNTINGINEQEAIKYLEYEV